MSDQNLDRDTDPNKYTKIAFAVIVVVVVLVVAAAYTYAARHQPVSELRCGL